MASCCRPSQACEPPEWLTATHSVSSVESSAAALATLTTAGFRALSGSQGKVDAASRERFRTEASRFCDELEERVHTAEAALERAFAADSSTFGVKASDTAAAATPQAVVVSKRTAKRKELRKQRRARVATGEPRDQEMAGDKQPSSHPPGSPSLATQHVSSAVQLQPPGSKSPSPLAFVFGGGC